MQLRRKKNIGRTLQELLPLRRPKRERKREQPKRPASVVLLKGLVVPRHLIFRRLKIMESPV